MAEPYMRAVLSPDMRRLVVHRQERYHSGALEAEPGVVTVSCLPHDCERRLLGTRLDEVWCLFTLDEAYRDDRLWHMVSVARTRLREGAPGVHYLEEEEEESGG